MSRKKPILLGVAWLIGGVGFLIPNIAGIKFLAFIIPLGLFCAIVKSKKDYFNINAFLILSIIFLILPTSYITFDMGTGPVESSINYIEAITDVAVVIFLVVIPVVVLIASIYAYVIGQVKQATMGIVSVITAIIIVEIFAVVLVTFGWDTFGVGQWILNFYATLITFIMELPKVLYDAVNKAIEVATLGNISLPDLPSRMEGGWEGGLEGDWFDSGSGGGTGGGGGGADVPDTPGDDEIVLDPNPRDNDIILLNMATYQSFIFGIHDCMPLMISLVCFVSMIAHLKEPWQERISEALTKYDKDPDKNERDNDGYLDINYKLIFYGIAILAIAFALFLMSMNVYGGDMGIPQTYALLLLIVTIVPLLAMNIRGLTYYKDAQLKDTVKGIVYGQAILVIFLNMYNVQYTMDAYTSVDTPTDIFYLINTYTFVAPAETLFFCIFIPGVVMGWRLYTHKKQEKNTKVQQKQDELRKAEGQIIADRRAVEFNKALMNYNANKIKDLKKKEKQEKQEKKKKDEIEEEIEERMETVDVSTSLLAQAEKRLNKHQQQKLALEKQLEELEEQREKIDEDILFTDNKNLAIIIVTILMSSFVFANMHFFAVATQISFFHFWLNGLGMIYMFGGLVFCLIHLRYGWLASITVHANHNALSTILTKIFTGALT